jgi:amino acid transporter
MGRLPFVIGLDRYLPSAFGRIHPKWGTPHVALIAQTVCAVIVVVMGQAGTSVRTAYQLLVSMTNITTFLPYLFMFAALMKMQSDVVGPEVVRIPGGKPIAMALGIVGFLGTLLVIVGSSIPDPGEPNKALAVVKIFGLTAVLLGGGAIAYWLGKRRAARTRAEVG